jgi:hypothetical protein
MGEGTLSDFGIETDEMRIGATRDDGIVERPAGDRFGLAVVDGEVEGRSFADDELGVEDAVHLLADMVPLDGRNEAEVTDVDAENGDSGALETMGGLEQGAVAAASHDEVGVRGMGLVQGGNGGLAARDAVEPLLANFRAVEDFLEGGCGFPGVRFAAVDEDDDFADFHGANPDGQYTNSGGRFKEE